MADININEYVRTDNGIIGKYIIQQNINYIDTGKQYIGFDIENDIVKHSSNIIDLIEVGDYVNGHKVEDIIPREKHPDFKVGIGCLGMLVRFEDDDIKSIVTHEQFSQMEYKVKE